MHYIERAGEEKRQALMERIEEEERREPKDGAKKEDRGLSTVEWVKAASEYVRWILTCKRWTLSEEATIPVPPGVVKKAAHIITGLMECLVREGVDRRELRELWAFKDDTCARCNDATWPGQGHLNCKVRRELEEAREEIATLRKGDAGKGPWPDNG